MILFVDIWFKYHYLFKFMILNNLNKKIEIYIYFIFYQKALNNL